MKTKKIVLMVLSFVLVAVVSVAGTLAYLKDSTDEVVNTFTVGEVDIELTETPNTDDDTWEGKLVPGREIAKDPKVTVAADSEDCWIFIEVIEENNTAGIVKWEPATGWDLLTDVVGPHRGKVYAYNAIQTKNAQVYFLKDITASPTDATNTNGSVYIDPAFEGLAEGAQTPKLTFYAYAVQSEGFTTAAAAWAAGFPTNP